MGMGLEVVLPESVPLLQPIIMEVDQMAQGMVLKAVMVKVKVVMVKVVVVKALMDKAMEEVLDLEHHQKKHFI